MDDRTCLENKRTERYRGFESLSFRMRMLGEHFNANGKPKKSYKDPKEAQVAAYDAGKEAYKCEFCGDWHIGGSR